MYRPACSARFTVITLSLAAFLVIMGAPGPTAEATGSTGNAESRTPATAPFRAADAYQALQVLFDELRYSRRVLMPAAGAETDFILLVNVDGELVGYLKSTGGDYERVLLSHEGKVLSRKRWMRSVTRARFAASEELWSGSGPELVELDLTVDCAGKVPVELNTTVRIGNVSEEWMF